MALEAYNTKNEIETSMMFYAISNKVLLMISFSNFTKEVWDKIKKIYLEIKYSCKFNILQKLLQSHQEENESVALYLNKIIDLKIQLVGCGCNWINIEFMVFIILQSLSSKFNHFVIIFQSIF